MRVLQLNNSIIFLRKHPNPLKSPNLIQNNLKHWHIIISMIVPEGIFVEVGLEIFRTNGMIDTRDTTFYQRPKPLNLVSMDIPINIDPSTMFYSPMLETNPREMFIARKLVSVQNGISI